MSDAARGPAQGVTERVELARGWAVQWRFWDDEHRIIMRGDGTSFGMHEDVLRSLIEAARPSADPAKVAALREDVERLRAERDVYLDQRDYARGVADRAMGARDESVAVLRRVEFEGSWDRCPCCLSPPSTHTSDCALSRALAADGAGRAGGEDGGWGAGGVGDGEG